MTTTPTQSDTASTAATTPDRNAVRQEVPTDPETGKPYINTVAAVAIAPFAQLSKTPEHVHTYTITPLGLWNARASGHDAESVVDVLLDYAKHPVPHALLLDIVDVMDRWGVLTLHQSPVHGLVLESTDAALLAHLLE